jgi:DNA repair photolyase
MSEIQPLKYYKARGALSNPDGRFESLRHEVFDDGWERDEEPANSLPVTLLPDKAKTIINYNDSPDIPFDRSINLYRGCEHGCIYCFARPTHSYWGLSAGLDFETKIFYKEGAVSKLEVELSKPGYKCQPVSLGINTDAYQPVERDLKLTRQLLEVLLKFRHPVSLITKSQLILRDLDILQALAEQNLVSIAISMTSLDNKIKSTLEPRAASAAKRLETIEKLSQAGVPTVVMVAPVIPVITDAEMERILEAAYAAGARGAGYVLLRLPHEVKDLFRQWLDEHHPGKATHVMSLIQQSRGGKDYDSLWGVRMRGTGVFADMLAQRFHKACKRIGFNQNPRDELDTSRFLGVAAASGQLSLGF